MLTNIQAVLSDKKQLTADIILFRFKLISPSEIIFNAGQYLILNVPQADGGSIKRLYSIASPPEQKDSVELLVKIVEGGIASSYLKNLAVGAGVSFQGPAGMFGLRNNDKDKIFLVTGTGVAPVRSILISKIHIKNQIEKTQNYYLFWGLPYYREVCLLGELKELSSTYPNFQFKICLSRETDLNMVGDNNKSYCSLGRINKGLEEALNTKHLTLNNSEFYLCGNRDVIETTRQYLAGLGVKDEDVVFEKF